MSEALTVEDRLAALEKEVAIMKLRLEQVIAPKPDWLEKICGSMEDFPEFEEVVRLETWRRVSARTTAPRR